MAEPEGMIIPLLREMRVENQALHGATASRLDVVERRLKKLEEAQISYRQALAGNSLFSKLVTGEFEEQIEALERQVRELVIQK